MVTQNTLLALENVKFATVLDLNKCLNHINLPILVHTCALFFELPFNMSTMQSMHDNVGNNSGGEVEKKKYRVDETVRIFHCVKSRDRTL